MTDKRDKNMRCPDHPEFNPDKDVLTPDCNICCGLHNGAKEVGHYSGEYNVSEYGIKSTLFKIDPINLERFGHARYLLAYDWYHSDGPTWYVDAEEMIIYLDSLPRKRIIEKLRKMGCRLYIRDWVELKEDKGESDNDQ